MKLVKSSNIRAIRYEENTKILSIQFKEGGLYHYEGVEQEVFNSFEKSESLGKFHVKYIKNMYKFTKEENKLT
jgi:KTSC domain